jgi:hypothetical protein
VLWGHIGHMKWSSENPVFKLPNGDTDKKNTLISHPSGAPEYTPVLSGISVTRSLVLYECFVDRCLSV